MATATADTPWIPEGLGPVADAHVHIFPKPIMEAIWRWFDAHAWTIRYRLDPQAILAFLLDRGVGHVVALTYAHKAGLARDLNRFMADQCRRWEGRVTGLATVFPGEPGAAAILAEGFALGLAGVKLHAHVQCFDMNGPAMDEVYKVCADHGKPVLMHVGREPKSPAYGCDPHQLCSAVKLARVLDAHPGLKVCVPHLGYDEIEAYAALSLSHDNLWLDTAMVLTDYFPGYDPVDIAGLRADRLIYGTDFPNLPYAWDRELRQLAGRHLPPDFLQRLLWQNAAALFGFGPPAPVSPCTR